MITCLPMRPNALLAMSWSDIGGNGGHPRGQRPSLDSPSVQSVSRKLFGDVDHHQTELDLQNETKQCEERDRHKYNFDFRCEQPINSPDSRYEWSQISTDSEVTEDKTDFNVSTNLNKISDQSIAQSSSHTQSQSATRASSPPEPKPPTISSIVSSSSSPTPTSVTTAPDSQPQPSSSVEQLTTKVQQKPNLVNHSKQKSIAEIFDVRKSAHNQRKRSAGQVFSHKSRASKRNRLECSSEDSGT
jgi:hypothetical protein